MEKPLYNVIHEKNRVPDLKRSKINPIVQTAVQKYVKEQQNWEKLQ